MKNFEREDYIYDPLAIIDNTTTLEIRKIGENVFGDNTDNIKGYMEFYKNNVSEITYRQFKKYIQENTPYSYQAILNRFLTKNLISSMKYDDNKLEIICRNNNRLFYDSVVTKFFDDEYFDYLKRIREIHIFENYIDFKNKYNIDQIIILDSEIESYCQFYNKDPEYYNNKNIPSTFYISNSNVHFLNNNSVIKRILNDFHTTNQQQIDNFVTTPQKEELCYKKGKKIIIESKETIQSQQIFISMFLNDLLESKKPQKSKKYKKTNKER